MLWGLRSQDLEAETKERERCLHPGERARRGVLISVVFNRQVAQTGPADRSTADGEAPASTTCLPGRTARCCRSEGRGSLSAERQDRWIASGQEGSRGLVRARAPRGRSAEIAGGRRDSKGSPTADSILGVRSEGRSEKGSRGPFPHGASRRVLEAEPAGPRRVLPGAGLRSPGDEPIELAGAAGSGDRWRQAGGRVDPDGCRLSLPVLFVPRCVRHVDQTQWRAGRGVLSACAQGHWSFVIVSSSSSRGTPEYRCEDPSLVSQMCRGPLGGSSRGRRREADVAWRGLPVSEPSRLRPPLERLGSRAGRERRGFSRRCETVSMPLPTKST